MKVKNSGMKYKTKKGSINIEKLILNLFLTLACIALIIFIFKMLFPSDNTDGGASMDSSSSSSSVSGDNSGWNSESIVIPPEDLYWYSRAVPESAEVEDSYFEDAVLIGNSTIEGIYYYSLLPEATVYSELGLNVTNIFTTEIEDDKTAFELLAEGDFTKVYICLGLNELGWEYSNVFKDRYETVIEEVLKIKPDAEIYIQSILPIGQTKINNDPIFTTEKIEEYNTLISELCKEMDVNLLHYPSELLTEDGLLLPEASNDGVHMESPYLSIYVDYLKTHTVEE